MGINCEFTECSFRHGEKQYGCWVEGKQTPENREIELTGKHENGKGNRDVFHVQFVNCTVVRIPQGLTIMFPNLKSLSIRDSKLKQISKNDLAEYKNLEKFIFAGNDFEYLPGDLFEGFRNLEFIEFCADLKVIEPNILDGLTKLKHVRFGSVGKYHKFYSTYPVYEPNATLQELKIDLHEKFFARFKFLDDLKKSERNLQQRVQELVLSHNKSDRQIESMKKVEAELKGKLQTSNESIISLRTQIEDLKVKLDTQSFLTTDIKAFIQDDTTKDFQIQIDDQQFPVHKFLLSARSPTLAELLKNNPEVENLNLVDISVEIFKIILKFLYTDELPGDDSNFLNIFAAAGKLKIEELKNHAATNLIGHIDGNNALDALKMAYKYNHKELKIKAFNIMKEGSPEIDFKDEWLENHLKLTKVMDAWRKKRESMLEIEKEFKKVLMTD